MMTKSEAISLLRRYRREQLFKPSPRLARISLVYRNSSYIEEIYSRTLVLELIRKVNEAPEDADPLSVIRDFYYFMDDMVCESVNPSTWAFASTLENETGDILRYLRWKEKMNDSTGG